MNDDQLHLLLRASQARAPLPPSFNREVWLRIEAAESNSPRSLLLLFWEKCLEALARPAPALASVVLCMLVGSGFGWARQREARGAGGELAYAASINPFMQMKNEMAP